MPPSLAALANRWAPADAVAWREVLGTMLVAVPHVAALAVMALTEGGPVANSAFLLTWGLFNCVWLALLRRPSVAGALSLGLILTLIQLSRLKYEMIWMTANFLDVMPGHRRGHRQPACER